MDITGKRALVLGGSAGIGLATALELERRGARVVAASRNATGRERAKAEFGESTELRDVDVRDREGLSALFQELAPLDILVCAATGGGRAVGPFLEMDLDGFQSSFDKLWGYTNAVRLGADQMSENATIVLVSGYPARKAMAGMSAISTVGNAVEGFVRAVAPELAPRRINIVSPGAIVTEMLSPDLEKNALVLSETTKQNLIPRAGQPEEVAQAILFLIENEYVTGTTIDVDGGALLP
ncbi:MAG: SDR family oxidoreductase [bacterium]|nr:short-chain dehydrogenase [Deltaproteobacteria bacterium]MCP4906997.1 SDR family oxidoreductase [bacterium]